MGYCFMTIEKVKDKGSLTKKYNHNYRKGEVSNADPKLASANEELVKLDPDAEYTEHTRTYVDAFNDKMEKLKETNPKLRKNAVLALEIVTTFSREDAEHVDIEKWKKDQVEWLRKTFNPDPDKYGDNVISVMFHGDEAGNVHCHSVVIPIDDKGKLNCSYFLDGRTKLIQMQDSYGQMMMDRHQLKRGLKGTVAKHETIKRFYAQANQAAAKEGPAVGKIDGRKETADEYKVRSDEVIKDLNLQILALQKKLERQEVEMKTMDMNEKINFYKKKKDFEQEVAAAESIKDLDIMKAKAQTMDMLNEALQHYPDKKKAKEIFKEMQELLNFEKERQEKIKLEKKDNI